MVGADSVTPELEGALAEGLVLGKLCVPSTFHQVCESSQSMPWMLSRAELMSGLVWEGEMSSDA